MGDQRNWNAQRATGRRIECADAWIAATALLYDAALITHNRADHFGVQGLMLVSHPKSWPAVLSAVQEFSGEFSRLVFRNEAR